MQVITSAYLAKNSSPTASTEISHVTSHVAMDGDLFVRSLWQERLKRWDNGIPDWQLCGTGHTTPHAFCDVI